MCSGSLIARAMARASTLCSGRAKLHRAGAVIEGMELVLQRLEAHGHCNVTLKMLC